MSSFIFFWGAYNNQNRKVLQNTTLGNEKNSLFIIQMGRWIDDQLLMFSRVWFHLQPGSRIGMKAPKIGPKYWTTEILTTKKTQNSHVSFQDIFFAEHFTASKASKFSKKKQPAEKAKNFVLEKTHNFSSHRRKCGIWVGSPSVRVDK